MSLPAGEYEKAYAIQDRFLKENGELFYPSYKGEPYYDDFITGENAEWDSDVDGPTILAEFFGDFMVVNGKVGTKVIFLYSFQLIISNLQLIRSLLPYRQFCIRVFLYSLSLILRFGPSKTSTLVDTDCACSMAVTVASWL